MIRIFFREFTLKLLQSKNDRTRTLRKNPELPIVFEKCAQKFHYEHLETARL